MVRRVRRVRGPTLVLLAVGPLLTPVSVAADDHADPLSVAVRANGGQEVSYAIEVRNKTDHAVPNAVITQQLPPTLDYVDAVPPPQRAGHHLTWTLAIPAHGTARITTTGTAHTTQAGTLRGHHQFMTTVCVREDAGPQACTAGRSALHEGTLPAAFALGLVGAAAGTLCLVLGLWRRRRARCLIPAEVLERADLEA